MNGFRERVTALNLLHNFFNNQDGATAVEYCLIAGGVSLAIVAALFAFGDDLQGVLEALSTVMTEDVIDGIDANPDP